MVVPCRRRNWPARRLRPTVNQNGRFLPRTVGPPQESDPLFRGLPLEFPLLKALVALCRLCLFCLAPVGLLFSVLMLMYFRTWSGRLWAIWQFSLLVSLLELVFFQALSAKSRKFLGLLLLGLLIGLLGNSPWAQRPDSRVFASSSSVDWARYTPITLVPESDWVELGLRLLYPSARAEKLLPHMRGLYSEMAQTPGYGALSPTLAYTAADLGDLADGRGHYYAFRASRPKRPLLVYLHGAMGNFQSYLYHWQKWAQPKDWNVICPTYGYGSWFHGAGGETAEDCLNRAIQQLEVDESQIVVVGLSNGATGAVRLIRRCPTKIKKVMLVSPVLEPAQFCSPEFRLWSRLHTTTTAQAQPTLADLVVIEGDEDVNVRPQTVEERLSRIEQEGLPHFPYRLIAGHDHHMMFTARPQIYQALDQLLVDLEPASH